MTTPAPPGEPPGDPPGTTARKRCPGPPENPKIRCVAWLKKGQTRCRAHDPARAEERSRDAAIRKQPGDLGTELGTYRGIARRTAIVLELLENGVLLEAGACVGPSIDAKEATAMIGALRFLASLIALQTGKGSKTGDAPPKAFNIEDALG